MTTIVDNQVIHRESSAVTDNVPCLRCDECSRPLISFCLLTYNQAPFIREAIEAALAQTYSPLEIIISDDFSNDNTYEIIQQVVRVYKGPHKILLNRNSQNMGLVPHVNKVFGDLASGLLLVAAAGDDISLPERTEELWMAWEASNRRAKLISSARSHIDFEGKIVGEWMPENLGYYDGNLEDFILNPSGSFNGASAMYHRDTMDLFGPLRSALVEDGPLIIRSRILGPVFALSKKLVKYRISAINLTGQLNPDYRGKMLRGNLWRISIYNQIIDDLNEGNIQNIIGIEVVKKLILFSNKHKNKHQIVIKLTHKYFYIRLISWLRLFFVLSKIQSVNNVVYLIPPVFYPFFMKYGLPSESRLWNKSQMFKKYFTNFIKKKSFYSKNNK